MKRANHTQGGNLGAFREMMVHYLRRHGGGLFREIEVRQRDMAVRLHENIFRLQVAIHEAVVMQRLQREQNLRGVKARHGLREAVVGLVLQYAEKLAPATKLHDEAQPMRGLEAGIHRDNERMVHSGEDLALGHDALDLWSERAKQKRSRIAGRV